MKQIFNMELERAMHNKKLILALVVGNAIVLWHFIQNVLPKTQYLNNYLLNKGEYPVSVFNTWIGGESYSVQSYLFHLLIPILLTIPYLDSLFLDIRSGYVKNIMIRVRKKEYFLAKLIVVLITANLVIIEPLVLNLLLTATVIPSLVPEPTSMTFSVTANCFMDEIYYTHPYIYIGVYLLIAIVYICIFSLFSLGITFFTDNYFLVLTSAFLLYEGTSFLFDNVGLMEYSPKLILYINQPYVISGVPILVEILIGLFVCGIIYFVKGRRYELL